MSFVTLILIKDKQLQTISAHYRVIKRLLEHKDFFIETLKQPEKTFADAGYIFVDCDNTFFINAQHAFNIHLEGFQQIIV